MTSEKQRPKDAQPRAVQGHLFAMGVRAEANTLCGTTWETLPLGDLTENLDALRVPVKETDRRPGPYPYYGASGVVDHVDSFIFEGEHLLIAEDGENLRTRKTPIAFIADGRFWVNNHAHIVRGNGRASTRYLAYALSLVDVSGYITGSTMPKLTQANLNRIPIPTPPIQVQDQIVEILGKLDDKIELNRRMNRTLEAMARALFRSWLVEPLETNGGMSRGWELRRMGDITTKIGSGATPKGGSLVYVKEGVAFIRSQNVYDGEFAWDGLVHITDEAATRLEGVTVAEDDILLNITGDSILRTCLVDPTVLPARVNQHVAIIRPVASMPPRYLHLFLLLPSTKSHLLGLDAGGTRKAVTKAQLEALPVPIPPQHLLDRFRNVTDPMYARVVVNEAESRSLKSLVTSLLPPLLAGKRECA